MNKFKILSLFSMVLVSSCITVPRIDKKDSKNNQFSGKLQDWMAVKHPQKIDTTIKQSKSDTTWGSIDTISSAWENPPVYWDSISGLHFYHPWDNAPNQIDPGFFSGTIPIFPTTDTLWLNLDSGSNCANWIKNHPPKSILLRQYAYIHDTITKIVVNDSQIKGLTDQLQMSRDSTNQYILKYTEQKSTSRLRLIWIIVMGIVIAVGTYFFINKSII